MQAWRTESSSKLTGSTVSTFCVKGSGCICFSDRCRRPRAGSADTTLHCTHSPAHETCRLPLGLAKTLSMPRRPVTVACLEDAVPGITFQDLKAEQAPADAAFETQPSPATSATAAVYCVRQARRPRKLNMVALQKQQRVQRGEHAYGHDSIWHHDAAPRKL